MQKNRTLTKERKEIMEGLEITAKYAALCHKLFLDFATKKKGCFEDLLNESKKRKFYRCYEEIAKILKEKNIFHPVITDFYWLNNGNGKKDLPLTLTHNYIVIEDGMRVFKKDKKKVIISHSSCLVLPARLKKIEKNIATIEQSEIIVKNDSFTLGKLKNRKVRKIFHDIFPSTKAISTHQGLIIEPISEGQYKNLLKTTQKILDLFNEPSK